MARELKLPPHTPWSELEDARGPLEELRDRRNKARLRRRDLSGRGANERAQQADAEAFATAARAGKKDPGAKAVDKLARDRIDATREARGLEIACEEAERELIAAVQPHREGWLAALDAEAATLRAAYRDAVDALAQAHEAMQANAALRAWLAGFPGEPWIGAVGARVGIIGPNGEARLLGEVIAALRALGDDPQPEPEPTEDDDSREQQKAELQRHADKVGARDEGDGVIEGRRAQRRSQRRQDGTLAGAGPNPHVQGGG